jgi:predicted neuraminidase
MKTISPAQVRALTLSFISILFVLINLTGWAESFSREKVFGPETSTGKYKHPSCITELHNKDLLLVWYGGQGEYAQATRIFATRKKHGESTWSKPHVIASNPFRSLGNPVVWQAPDRTVWLFYVTRFGATWSTSRIKAKISSDNAQTWSDSFLITMLEGTMVRNRPIVLENGDYLLPIYHETGHDTEFTGSDTTSRFMRYKRDLNKWQTSGTIHSDNGNLQPAVIQIDQQHLIAFCRRAGDYEATDQGWMIRADSFDGGKSWTRGQNTKFPNPNAAVELLKLRNGHLLLIYNDHMYERTPLTAAISTDNGKSFPLRRDIESGQGSFSYPTAIQTHDGKIHVTYTSHERTVINHAVFTESWITKEQ